jgi:hypothetical protein
MTALLTSSEAIGLELQARVAARLVANGAETNVGASVFRGRRVVDDDQVPCTSIIEGDDDITENDGPSTSIRTRQQFVLLGYVPCDPDHPNDAAHKALRDLKRAVFTTDGKPDRTLGRQVRRVRYEGRDIGPRADGAALVVVALEVSVEYVEDLADPG